MDNALSKLGFRRDWVYEVLVTTKNGGNVNAAPMGVKTEDMKHITLEVYKNSQTCKNLIKTRECTINFVDDLTLFYEALKSKKKFGYTINEKAYIKLKVVEATEEGEKTKFRMKTTESNISDKIELINRGRSLALECLIKSTKPGAGRKDLAGYWQTIKKVAPDSEYERMAEKIVEDAG